MPRYEVWRDEVAASVSSRFPCFSWLILIGGGRQSILVLEETISRLTRENAAKDGQLAGLEANVSSLWLLMKLIDGRN